MTVTTPVFETQLRHLRETGYTVIPLRHWVDYLRGQAPPPPFRSVVITVDDGHRSVHTELFPLVRQYQVPVTLFIYPSAISNAPYALTWEQLAEMKDSGLFEIQSHTYWHPNFKTDKKRLAPVEYERFVEMQLTRSKQKLEHRLGVQIDALAWPFGIYDEELMQTAEHLGYRAAFTLDRRHARPSDKLMALPRYLVTNKDQGKTFARLLQGEKLQ